MRRDVFQAIADPTRRQIISMIANENLNLNAVAEKFDISRPAISKHIKILTECGLVTINVQGREHYCEARLEKLNEVNEWVAQYKKFWEQKFDQLEAYLQELQKGDEGKGMRGEGKGTKNAKKKSASNKSSSKKETTNHKTHGNSKQKRKSNRR